MSEIAIRRLYNHHLEGAKFATPQEVVAWYGAVQGQEYALAKWALGLRLDSTNESAVEQVLNEGHILRTHAMRPTWHFIANADIRWILDLTAPRVHQVNGTMYRKLELDETTLKRGSEIIAAALSDSVHLTREELGAALTQAGIDTSNGMRLGYIVHYAELEALICSGVRRGKQHTYALIDQRAPNARRLTRDEALAELTLRFFTSHGPAMIKDFSWWSGLTITDVKRGIAMLGDRLIEEHIDGHSYWSAASGALAMPPNDTGHLLPVYDEYTVAYKHHGAILHPDYRISIEERYFVNAFIFNGEIVAMFRRTFDKKAVVIERQPFRSFSDAEEAAFQTAAGRFAAFLEMPLVLA